MCVIMGYDLFTRFFVLKQSQGHIFSEYGENSGTAFGFYNIRNIDGLKPEKELAFAKAHYHRRLWGGKALG